MSWENADKINEKFNKLTDKQKLEYYEAVCGESLFEIWRDWEDELVKEQLDEFEEILNKKDEGFDIEISTELQSRTFRIYNEELIDFIKAHLDAGKEFEIFFPEYEIKIEGD